MNFLYNGIIWEIASERKFYKISQRRFQKTNPKKYGKTLFRLNTNSGTTIRVKETLKDLLS